MNSKTAWARRFAEPATVPECAKFLDPSGEPLLVVPNRRRVVDVAGHHGGGQQRVLVERSVRRVGKQSSLQPAQGADLAERTGCLGATRP